MCLTAPRAASIMPSCICDRSLDFAKVRTEQCSLNPLKERRPPLLVEAWEKAVEDTVIKVDIVNNVAERTGVSKVKAEEAVEALFEAMKEALRRGERIELRGFGVFVVKPRKRGVGRNPRTGEVTDIPPGKTIRFKPGKELQQ